MNTDSHVAGPDERGVEFQILASQLAARAVSAGVPGPQVMLAYMSTATKIAVDHYGLDTAKELLAELALSIGELTERNLMKAS